jgi:hypothetical protein
MTKDECKSLQVNAAAFANGARVCRPEAPARAACSRGEATHYMTGRFAIGTATPASWNAAPSNTGVTQGFVGADIRSHGARRRQGHPAGSVDSGNGLLRYAICAYRMV